MNVIKYLNEHGLQSLKDNYHIFVKEYPEEHLYVLNYCQIRSPRFDPIADECRGLILTEKDSKWEVVSRSFDRFYNYGENPEQDAKIDFSRAEVFEKLDGSLIKVYWWNGEWRISTRGTAFAESDVNGWGFSFRELFLQTVGLTEDEFQDWCEDYFFDDETVIFELCTKYNRVVVSYESKIALLAYRRHSGAYPICGSSKQGGIPLPARAARFNMSSLKECSERAAQLENLEEGFVVYQDGKPVCKVKNPAYVAAHRIRGEGLSPRRIAELVVMNEQNEYLAVFPEDTDEFTPYIEAQKELLSEMARVYNTLKDAELTQKQFAQVVNPLAYKSVLFTARSKGIPVEDAYADMRSRHKEDMIMNMVNQ